MLTLDPKTELVFVDPGNESRTVNLTMKNDSDITTYFKIKVTAPKRYCVRPNQGEIKPNGKETVEITLTALKPEELGRCRDKFLVQSLQGAPGLVADNLFKMSNKEDIEESKLICKFVVTEAAKHSAPTMIVQQNQKLKVENANLNRELDSNRFDHSGSRGAMAQKSADMGNTYPLPVVLIAFLLGILLGHFML